MLPKFVYIFNTITIKILNSFCSNQQSVNKIHLKGSCIVKIILKRNKIKRLTLSNFKTYYKATAVKTVRHWQKDQQIGQWNRTGSVEINRIYKQMIFGKSTRQFNGRQNSFFNKWSWENWIRTSKRMKLDSYLTQYTKFKNASAIYD